MTRAISGNNVNLIKPGGKLTRCRNRDKNILDTSEKQRQNRYP